MKIKNNSQRLLFFFDFSNPLKQIKMNLFNPKTLWKLIAKTLGNIGIFALQNLGEISSREGVYIASQKSARWQSGKVRNDLPVDRPVDRRNGHISDRSASCRPPGRPGQAFGRPPGRLPGRPRVGCFQSVDRAVDRPFRLAMCTSLVHIGRPVRSTVSVVMLKI